MADNPYEEKLQAAELMFDDDSEECVRLAKLNLIEPGLPAYYDIQNRILISTASEYWNEAHEWRQDAHRAYQKFHTRALRAQDIATLESLKHLPEELEELEEIVEGYLTEIIDKEYEGMPQTPPEERLRIFYDGEASDVSNDEAEDEPVVETEQKEFILSFRGG
ncbi:hypothetical protein C7974DRAFT_426853 [Boeremia exigua]|uniref:uncharacterized protein n=1 Tax=Boeremia exigua TaxID=749465 RepID=UPI001E8D2A98|nr:uncharacterized protein C7974DRAFT_426853 [Boeremia exigua]KAH6618579.1 hypothetical protein C7974DRAFT_426853 [Boeremia exigua]